jgi:DNA-directed RNA polymerase specialized sigma24 family protein
LRLETVDWTALSPQARLTLQRIAVPISLGYSHSEVAEMTGSTKREVDERLRDLREELKQQAA